MVSTVIAVPHNTSFDRRRLSCQPSPAFPRIGLPRSLGVPTIACMASLDGIKVNSRAGVATFDVDTRIYPMDAVLGAAYVFIDRAYVMLDQPGANRIRVELCGKRPLSDNALTALCGDFLNELLGQVLRERSAKRYGRLREALLAKALFSAAPGLAAEGGESVEAVAPPAAPAAGADAVVPSLDDLPDESVDYLDDPLGIAMPWEEKFGKKKEGEG